MLKLADRSILWPTLTETPTCFLPLHALLLFCCLGSHGAGVFPLLHDPPLYTYTKKAKPDCLICDPLASCSRVQGYRVRERVQRFCVYLLIKPYAHWYYLNVVSDLPTHCMCWTMYLKWPHLCLPVYHVLQHVRCLQVNFPPPNLLSSHSTSQRFTYWGLWDTLPYSALP